MRNAKWDVILNYSDYYGGTALPHVLFQDWPKIGAHMKYYLHSCLAELSSSFVFFYQQT